MVCDVSLPFFLLRYSCVVQKSGCGEKPPRDLFAFAWLMHAGQQALASALQVFKSPSQRAKKNLPCFGVNNSLFR
jgi:hypothetical protein